MRVRWGLKAEAGHGDGVWVRVLWMVGECDAERRGALASHRDVVTHPRVLADLILAARAQQSHQGRLVFLWNIHASRSQVIFLVLVTPFGGCKQVATALCPNYW